MQFKFPSFFFLFSLLHCFFAFLLTRNKFKLLHVKGSFCCLISCEGKLVKRERKERENRGGRERETAGGGRRAVQDPQERPREEGEERERERERETQGLERGRQRE